MGLEIAKAFFSVAVDTQGVGQDFRSIKDSAEREFGGVEKAAERMASNVRSIFTKMMGFVSSYVGSRFLQSTIGVASEMQRVQTNLGSVLRATEHAAGFTVEQLTEMAEKLADLTTFDAPKTLRAMARLGTYSTITGDEFERVIRAGMDITTIFGGDLERNIEGLAQALNDPARGLGALSRQGFKFSDAQRKIIKDAMAVGDVLTAQGVIWETIEGQEGAAMRGAEGIDGAMSSLDTTLRRLSAHIGATLLPLYSKWQGLKTALAHHTLKLARATGSLVPYILATTTAAIALTTTSSSLRLAMRLTGTTFTQILVASGWGIALIALGASVAALVWGIQELWKWASQLESVQTSLVAASQALQAAWLALQEAGMVVWESLREAVNELIDVVANYFGVEIDALPNRMEEAVNWMIESVSNFALNVASYVAAIVTKWQATWELIKTYTALKLVEMADAAIMLWNTLKAGVIATGVYIWETMKGVAHNIATVFEGLGRIILGVFKGVWEGVKAIFTGGNVWAAISSEFTKEMAKMERSFVGTHANAAQKANAAFVEHMGADSPLAGTIDTLKGDITRLTGDLSKEADKIKRRSLETVLSRQEGEAAAEEAADDEPPPREVMHYIEAGKYGIAQLGERFQDALMKGKEGDVQDKMLGAAEHGNKLQDEMLKDQKLGRRELIQAIKENGGMVLE